MEGFYLLQEENKQKRRNVAVISCSENENTHFMFNNFFNRAVYEMCKKNVERVRPNMTHALRMLDN
jgi:hypothetical protein